LFTYILSNGDRSWIVSVEREGEDREGEEEEMVDDGIDR